MPRRWDRDHPPEEGSCGEAPRINAKSRRDVIHLGLVGKGELSGHRASVRTVRHGVRRSRRSRWRRWGCGTARSPWSGLARSADAGYGVCAGVVVDPSTSRHNRSVVHDSGSVARRWPRASRSSGTPPRGTAPCGPAGRSPVRQRRPSVRCALAPWLRSLHQGEGATLVLHLWQQNISSSPCRTAWGACAEDHTVDVGVGRPIGHTDERLHWHMAGRRRIVTSE